jgi:hypothetical protein
MKKNETGNTKPLLSYTLPVVHVSSWHICSVRYMTPKKGYQEVAPIFVPKITATCHAGAVGQLRARVEELRCSPGPPGARADVARRCVLKKIAMRASFPAVISAFVPPPHIGWGVSQEGETRRPGCWGREGPVGRVLRAGRGASETRRRVRALRFKVKGFVTGAPS